MNDIVLEQRSCVVCKKSFKAMQTSTQTWCRVDCRDEILGKPGDQTMWRDLNRAFWAERVAFAKENETPGAREYLNSGSESSKHRQSPSWLFAKQSSKFNKDKTRSADKNTTKDTPTILSSNNEKKLDDETLNTRPEICVENTNTIKKTRSGSMPKDTQEQKRTPSETKNNASTTRAIATSDSERYSSVENRDVEIVPSGESTKQLANLNEETLRSLNMLRSSNLYLFKLMKGLVHPEMDPTIRTVDVDKARTAAELGKQIISGVRMQLDICKFVKELRDEK